MGLDFEIPFDESLDAEGLEKEIDSGSKYLPGGKFHVVCVSVSEATPNSGNEGVEFEFTALAGPHAGKVTKAEVIFSDKTRPRQLKFASRLGLIQRLPNGGWSKAKSWTEAVGAQVIVEVEEEEYTKKNGQKGKVGRVNFGIWSLDDPTVKDVPRGNISQANGTHQEYVQQAAANERAAVAATSGKDCWDDL